MAQTEARTEAPQPAAEAEAIEAGRVCPASQEGVPAAGHRGRRAGRERGAHAGRAGARRYRTRIDRRGAVDPGDHRRARPEAHRAGQPDPASRGLPGARGSLARAASPRQQHRNGRDAQDPGHEHLQEGAGQDAREVRGHGLGSEPALQEDLHRRIFDVRRRALRLPGRRLLFRQQPQGRRAAAQHGQGLRRGAHAVHRRRRAVALQHGELAGADEPARSHQDRVARRTTPTGTRCARPRTARYIGLAMPRVLARLPYGAKTDPVEAFDFEEDDRRQRSPQVRAG